MRKLNKILAMLAVVTMLMSLVTVVAVAEDVYREPITLTVYDELANQPVDCWLASSSYTVSVMGSR